MNIPVALIFSPVKGGHFEATGRFSGQWWRGKELLAEWSRGRAGEVSITWHSRTAKDEHFADVAMNATKEHKSEHS